MADPPARPVAAIVVAIAALVAGVLIRAVLLPTPGLTGDLDVFVLWTHGIAVNGLPHAYDQSLSFPPVMAYIWAVLAAIEPAFKTVTDASDPGIRALMKVPATLADIGLAVVVVYALRRTPWVAVAAGAAILLHPAVIDVSAWWGQYESIYLLSAMIAIVLAINGRNGLAAAFLAVSIMTKPQALPFLVPFAAWFWATGGPRGFLRAALIGLAVVVVLWLPFVPAGGPANYLKALATYQGEVLNILSLRAWNLWWLVQSLFAGGHFVSDDLRFIGPLTFRAVGLILTGSLELVVFVCVLRDPRPRSLILGCAAATLIAFCFLTTMHERYAFAAIGFLMFLVPERPVRWLGVAFGVVFTMNLFSAVPPAPWIGAILPYTGPITVLGSIAMLALTLLTLKLLATPSPSPSGAA
jgi:Gpi18-like mannosyltransferase